MFGLVITEALIYKFLRFGVVGVSGTMLDFGITYMSKEVFKTSKYIANALGFVIAASSNYLLNRIWTFNSHNNQVAAEYTRFFLVAFIGLGINTLFIYLIHKYFKQNFYIAKAIATVITLFWNFGANYLYTFA